MDRDGILHITDEKVTAMIRWSQLSADRRRFAGRRDRRVGDGAQVTVFLVDRSTGQIRALASWEYRRAIGQGVDAGYFTAWSRSAAECAQRAVFRETAKDSR